MVHLDESKAKARLRDLGLRVPAHVRWYFDEPVPDPMSYPVAVKLLGEDIAHKSELGGVLLDIADQAALIAAGETLRARAHELGGRADSLLVEAMVDGGIAEVLVGIRRSDECGYCLTLAVGGIWVELLGDSVVLPLPASRAQMEAALRSLQLFPLLNGWRGRPLADTDDVLDQVERLADAVLASGDIEEIEINPLIVTANGAYVADALMTLRENLP